MTPTAFKAARVTLGLSQRQLAERLGCTERTIRKWEKGERGIPGPADTAMGLLIKMMPDEPPQHGAEGKATTKEKE